MEDLAEKIDNVHFMNKNSFLYINPEDSTDVVRILGATLWSNVPDEHVSFISRALNDYHICTINDNGSKRKLSVADTNKWHKEDVAYLTEEIQKAQENNENVVILTHHAPLTENTSAPHFKGSQGNYAFATDLSSMMKHHVVLWLFGHTHYSSEQIEPNSGTMVASNQMGYRHERGAGYRPELVYDVPSRANDTRVAPTGDGKCALN
jgi:Icc-related predicted phosphoesterase